MMFTGDIDLDNYPKAIARLFNSSGAPVGAGFLIAPGYVLTCAHVVLQANGVSEDDYSSYERAPSDLVSLDFPVSSNGQKIDATVVEWRPYRNDSGDIAVLRLLMPEPAGINPLLMVEVSCSQVREDQHFVFGFASPTGGLSEAYRPKTVIADNRFLLCKANDPDDENIRPGFSGAPVWNTRLQGVIGMVATAGTVGEKHIAQAVSTLTLQSSLCETYAFYLNDLIAPHLTNQQLKYVVETAFRLCDSERSNSSDLCDCLRSLTKLSSRKRYQGDREIDRLTQFVGFLSVMDGLPVELAAGLELWVTFRGFDFNSLYVQANRERQARNIDSGYAREHLVVDVQLDEINLEVASVAMWIIDENNPLEPSRNLVSEDEIPIPLEDIPCFIDEKLKDTSLTDKCVIHLFVPRTCFDREFDTCQLDEDCILGGEYALVLRMNEKPRNQYRQFWEQKWQALQQNMNTLARDVFCDIDCTNPSLTIAKSAQAVVLNNAEGQSIGELLRTRIAKRTALPLVLWSRRNDLSCTIQEEILDANCRVRDLPQQIRQHRENAATANNRDLLGYHLSLVWEDPKIVTPTMNAPFDPEAC